jgi:Lon-like ATP-dependent protease
VYGPNLGTLLEIEVSAIPAAAGKGQFTITGVVDEEELGGGSRTLRRKSMARGSVENVLTVLRRFGLNPQDYDLHINFPGGTPIDGPSAGIAMATAIASAIKGQPINNRLAMTGEVGIHGNVKPVGGVLAKVEAAFQAGATEVIIPKDNWQAIFADLEGLKVIAVERIEEVFGQVFPEAVISLDKDEAQTSSEIFIAPSVSYLQADSVE